MSDSEGADQPKKKNEEPMPEHKIRFTDMPPNLVQKAIRRKFPCFPPDLFLSLVVDKCNANKKFDKDVAKEITRSFAKDQDLCDECAGWHVIVGKSFASAIQYQTKWVLFFDLLGDTHKSFLVFKTQ